MLRFDVGFEKGGCRYLSKINIFVKKKKKGIMSVWRIQTLPQKSRPTSSIRHPTYAHDVIWLFFTVR